MKKKTSIRLRNCLLAVIACFLPLLAFAELSTPAVCQTPYTFSTILYRAAAPQGGEQAGHHFNPQSLAIDDAGDIYFADARHHVICRVQRSGRINIIAGKFGDGGSTDGTGGKARFDYPRGIAIDAADNIFVADTCNNMIRRITPDGVVTTVAGLAGTYGSADGVGSNARFMYPASLAVDRSGNIYVADLYNYTIRKVTSHGVVTTIAGRAGVAGCAFGRGSAALFNFPTSIAVDGFGNIYVADYLNNSICKVTPDGTVTTVAGTLSNTAGNADGVGRSARFCRPYGIAVDKAGNIYVSDSGNESLRCITPNGAVTTIAGLAGQSGFVDGTGNNARFSQPTALAFDHFGNLYVTDLGNTAIRKGSPAAMSTKTNPALPLTDTFHAENLHTGTSSGN